MAHMSDDDVSPTPTSPQPPPVVAAFLVAFDNRKGYTITWQQSVENVKLEGAIEFKSLPSGLHNVKEDLVYFVHEEYAGISAFIRQDDPEAARNATMLAIGVLVPEAGRTGKSFLYARALRKLATTLIEDPDDYAPLEAFWNEYKLGPKADQASEDNISPAGYQKPRGLSTSTLTLSSAQHVLPAHHPALTLPDLLTSFGPLLFPVVRSALLCRRILILGEAPVETMCNMVYNLSILSALSRPTEATLPFSTRNKSRGRPLFNIGIADIPFLEALTDPWIACTTDDVLATKPKLFDILIVLPNSNTSHKIGNRTYPKVIVSTPELTRAFPRDGLKATQRDAGRFMNLKKRLQVVESGAEVDNLTFGETDAESTSSGVSEIVDRQEAVEPLPWSVIAYTSLIWWASAGDRRSGLMEADELAAEQDEAILHDTMADAGTTKEVAIVAYFHKLSSLLFSVLSKASVRSEGGEDRYRDQVRDDGQDREDQGLLDSTTTQDEEPVEVTEDDVRTMGLDVWSDTDKQFIIQIIEQRWKRKAVVQSGTIECCGIKIV